MLNTERSHQAGNMLIYILGAIALLGVLIVVSKGNFQPGASIDVEAQILKVSQVRKYTSDLERGVAIILRNGMSESDISFAHAKALSVYGTPGTKPKGEIFHPQGGAVEWQDPPAGIQASSKSWVFTGENTVAGVGCSASETRCQELMVILPDVTKAFCIQMNNSVGIANTAGNPPKEANSFGVTPFTGTFPSGTSLNVSGTAIDSKDEGCIEGNSGTIDTGLEGHYYYYKVLLPR